MSFLHIITSCKWLLCREILRHKGEFGRCNEWSISIPVFIGNSCLTQKETKSVKKESSLPRGTEKLVILKNLVFFFFHQNFKM